MHKYNNQDHAMMTAMLTAGTSCWASGGHDVWNVNEDAEYAEDGVSGARDALASERMVRAQGGVSLRRGLNAAMRG